MSMLEVRNVHKAFENERFSAASTFLKPLIREN